MYSALSDRLACPRCGPRFGLVLLAHRVRERRVLEGELGCSNCRERYPVTGGFADLRAPPRPDRDEPPDVPEPGDPEEAFRLAALLGVREGPGFLLLSGPAARYAASLAELLEGIEIVAVDPRLRGWDETPGVTRIDARPRIPVQSGLLRGVALSGEGAEEWIEEGIRTLAADSRLVVLDAGAGLPERLEEAGLELLLVTDEGIVVGERG